MKFTFKKRILALLGCTALVVSLAGCMGGPKEPEPTDVQMMENAISKDPFYVLVVGNDSRKGTIEIDKADYADGSGRADTMMLVRIDPVTHAVGIVTIPRDTATPYNGLVTKLNEVYRSGGMDALVGEVSKLTGVAIKYHLDMGFVEFEKFVSELGGITATVPIDMQLQSIVSGDQIQLSAGSQNLNGPQALVLARTRKAYADNQDACRQIQDRQLVEAGIKQVAADPGAAAARVQTLLGNVKTNWPADDLVRIVGDFAQNADKITFVSGTGPYAGDIDESAGGIWLAVRDEATWKQVIQAVEAGKDPTTIVALPQIVVN